MLVHRSLSLTDTHADALQRALMMLASACHQAVSAVSLSVWDYHSCLKK